MAGFGFSDWNKALSSGGGANYFNLKDGESAVVRFAYASIANDIKWYAVHEFTGQGNTATIACAEPEPGISTGVCKWCQMGNIPVKRVILPVYDCNQQKMLYWKRTVKYVNDSLFPLFAEVENAGKQVCSQQYKIVRHGQRLDTTYTAIPVGQPDNTTIDMLPEIKDPFDTKMIKPSDCDFNPNAVPQNNQNQEYQQNNFAQQNTYGQQPAQGYQQNTYGQQGGFNNYQTPAPTRRTADTF